MLRIRFASVLFVTVLAIVGVVGLLRFISVPEVSAAQIEGPNEPTGPAPSSAETSPEPSSQASQTLLTYWDSSAEPPPGTPAELLSPPDTLAPAAPQADEAIEALISWRVTGSALKPRENDVNYNVSATGGCVYVSSGDASTVWNTPVSLPQGSHIDTLRMYYYDTSASNSSAWFTVYDLYGVIVDEWSVSSNTDIGNSFNDSSVISHTIDYSVYSYLINWRPSVTGSTMQLCGFRVFYEPAPFGVSFLPLVSR